MRVSGGGAVGQSLSCAAQREGAACRSHARRPSHMSIVASCMCCMGRAGHLPCALAVRTCRAHLPCALATSPHNAIYVHVWALYHTVLHAIMYAPHIHGWFMANAYPQWGRAPAIRTRQERASRQSESLHVFAMYA